MEWLDAQYLFWPEYILLFLKNCRLEYILNADHNILKVYTQSYVQQ